MTRVLVVHGAGLNMRGKAQIELFGPATLDQMNEQIRGYAEGLGVDLEIFHSNIEGEIVNALYDAHDRDIDGALFNPGGFTTGTGPLSGAIAQLRFFVSSAAPGPISKHGSWSRDQKKEKTSYIYIYTYMYILIKYILCICIFMHTKVINY